MKQRTCKKCGADLPEWYKYDLCQHCMGKKGYKIKTAIKNTGIAGGIVAGGLAIVKLVPKGVKTLSKLIPK